MAAEGEPMTVDQDTEEEEFDPLKAIVGCSNRRSNMQCT
jgi:hypothetical protein